MSKRAKTPRVVAIVQARMGSTRLPGKVLRPIAGKPLLWHVTHRLKRCHMLHEIVIATSTNPRDDAIESFCRDEGIEIVRAVEHADHQAAFRHRSFIEVDRRIADLGNL